MVAVDKNNCATDIKSEQKRIEDMIKSNRENQLKSNQMSYKAAKDNWLNSQNNLKLFMSFDYANYN